MGMPVPAFTSQAIHRHDAGSAGALACLPAVNAALAQTQGSGDAPPSCVTPDTVMEEPQGACWSLQKQEEQQQAACSRGDTGGVA